MEYVSSQNYENLLEGSTINYLMSCYKRFRMNRLVYDHLTVSRIEIYLKQLEEANLNNSNIDFKNKEILDNALENSKKYDKLVEFFEREKVTSWTELRDIQDVFIDQAATQGVTSIEDLTIEGDDGLKDFLQQTFDQATLA